MSIKHAYVNPQADVGDPTITQPSNWNALHVFVPPKRFEWLPRGATAGLDTIGVTASIVSSGTNTARLNGPTPANLFQSLVRAGQVSGAVAGNGCGWFGAWYCNWRGNSAGLGGFRNYWRFGISDAVLVGTARMFCGFQSNYTPTDVDPSTLTQLYGIGCNSGDTTMQLYSAGTAAQARVSLGANFPVNTVSTDVYELALSCIPNDTLITYTVNRYTTSQITPAFSATGTFTGPTAQLAAAGTMFMPYIWRFNGGTASAVAVDLMAMYLETDL